MSAIYSLFHRIAFGIFLVVNFLITACSLVDQSTNIKGADVDRSDTVTWRNWGFTGRIAIKNNRQQGWNVGVDWQETGENYQITMIAPLGQGIYQLTGNSRQALLSLPDGNIYTATNAEYLFEQYLGWNLNIAALSYWVRGIPSPNMPIESIDTDSSGQLIDFMQGNWQISILEYMQIENIWLPKKLFLQDPQLKLRLFIQKWEGEFDK